LSKILPNGVKSEVEAALLVINNYLPTNENMFPAIGQVLTKGWIDYTPFEPHLRQLTQAIYDEKACLVTYQKKLTEQPQEILFAPKGLMIYHESIYITGCKVERKPMLVKVEETTLALQRIQQVETTTYTTINIDSPKKLEDGGFGVILHEPFQVTVKFSADVATYVNERHWSDDQKIKVHKNGSITLTMTTRNKLETTSWLLGFGPSARLISPTKLAEEIKVKLKKTLEHYK
jgi:predicted DNA-binding transcriptional regulator YafY